MYKIFSSLAFILLVQAKVFSDQIPITSVSKYPMSTGIVRAMTLYADGKGEPADFAEAYPIFKAASETGDPVGMYFIGHMHLYGRGTKLDESMAWTYFKRAAEKGVAEAWGRMGYMVEKGLERDSNLELAINYYRKAASEDVQSAVNLAWHIVEGRAEGSEFEAVQALERGVAADNVFALNNLGYFHAFGRLQNSDPDYGIELLERALEKGYPRAAFNLIYIWAGRSPLIEADSEKLSAVPNPQKAMEKNTHQLIQEAVYTYRRDGIEAGLIKLEEKKKLWLRKEDLYRFRRQVWWEAQVLSGRENPEWAYRLFDWLYAACSEYNTKERHVDFYYDAAMLYNLSGEQLATGRIAELMQTADLVREGLRKKYDVTIDLSPVSALRKNEPSIPDLGSLILDPLHPQSEKNKPAYIGKPLYYGDVYGILVHPIASFYQGQWRESLGYAQWIQKWIESVQAEGLDNFRGRSEEIWQLEAKIALLRGRIYRNLGFYDRALEAFAVPIERDETGYGKRHVHEAITHQSLLKAKLGLLDRDERTFIEQIGQSREGNKFENKQAPLEVRLALAVDDFYQGAREQAFSGIDEIIELSSGARLVPILIEALKYRIELALEAEMPDRVESDLIRVLNLCREVGFKLYEPELYHKYARLKALEGDWASAIKLQLTAITFYKSIDFYTWLPLRYMELADWLFESGDFEMADYYRRLAIELIQVPDSEYPVWITDRVNQSNQRVLVKIQSERAVEAEPDVALHRQSPQRSQRFSSTVLDIQPTEQVIIPLESKPASAIYTLTNTGERSRSVQLVVRGTVDRLERTDLGAVLVEFAADIEDREEEIDLELAAGYQTMIHVYAPGNSAPLSAELIIRSPDLADQRAFFHYPDPGKGSGNAVINAVSLVNNPFYNVSFFQLFQRSENETAEAVSLRFRTSSSARIEAYSAAGDLLFVDADGDGAFHSPGDLLRADQNFDGIAELAFKSGSDTASIEIMVFAPSVKNPSKLEVYVDTIRSEGWQTDAVNEINYRSDP